jgi:replicative DNA helicase
LTDLKYALHKGFIPPGDGNEGMLILASTYKHVGFDMIDAYHMLKGVNEKRAEIYNIPKRTNDEIWKEVVEIVYSPSWKGGTYSLETSKLLRDTANKFGITENSKLESFNSIKESFFDFADKINHNVIKTGIKSLDENLLITTGMMVGILGAPSAGKTAIATAIIENSAKEGMKPLFHSLDMTKHLMMMRLIQRKSGVDTSGLLRKQIDSDPSYDASYNMRKDTKVSQAVEDLAKIYRNVEFNFTRGSTIESIEEDIKLNKIKNGEKFKLVVIDYLEKVRGPYSDATANSGYVASRLSDLASTYDVCIVLLLQPQKSAGDPSDELLSMRKVKGASVIEQDCRVVLTMWRPGFDPRDNKNDKFASIAIVKNNMGEVKTLDYKWSGLKGEVSELTKLERSELQSLREAIAAEAAEESGSGWDM